MARIFWGKIVKPEDIGNYEIWKLNAKTATKVQCPNREKKDKKLAIRHERKQRNRLGLTLRELGLRHWLDFWGNVALDWWPRWDQENNSWRLSPTWKPTRVETSNSDGYISRESVITRGSPFIHNPLKLPPFWVVYWRMTESLREKPFRMVCSVKLFR